MTKKLFGGSESKQASSNASGYSVLPAELQNYFKNLASQGSDIVSNASQYFAPMGMTDFENTAGQMMLPENFGAGVSQYLNPFRDIITEDVNKAFEGEFGALKQRADEAGAFGGSRYRSGQGDLERSRLDSIIAGLAGQFNNAAGQMQTGIGNLLGFGGLQRGVEFAQQQAVPNAMSFYSNLINPLLGGSYGTSYGKSSSETGIIPGLTGAIKSGASAAAPAAAPAASDIRLKDDIIFIGLENGHKMYEFRYKGMPEKYRGVMAQDIMEYMPDAISNVGGYMFVDYSKLGVQMEVING